MKNFYPTISTSTLVLLFTHFSLAQSVDINPLWRETAQVQTIEFSPDDNLLITGGATGNCYPYQCGQIKVWRIIDSTLLRTITTTPDMGIVNDVDISSNGNNIISGNGTVYCYPNGGCAPDKPGQFKFKTDGTLKKNLNNPGGNVYAIAYSPNETVIAAGTGYNNTGEIRIYDSHFSLLRTLPGHKYDTDGLAFTPDGQYLISGGDEGLVKWWNYNNGTLIRSKRHGTYLDGGAYVNVDISPDGNYVASGGQGYNMVVKIWRVSDGKLMHTLPIDGSDGYTVVKFTPDGKYVAAGLIQYGSGGLGWYGRILFWRVSDGAFVKEYIDKQGSPQSGGIRAIAFSSSNKNYLAYSVSNQLKLATIDFNEAVAAEKSVPKLQPSILKFNSSAFPNPFQAATTIQYTVPEKQFVTLSVYDVYGKQIAILVDEKKEAGTYKVKFDASKLAGGIYFYKISTENYSEVKKIIVNGH